MSESRVWENHMHGLTGGSWKRSRRLPRQLPTLLTDKLASYGAVQREVLRSVEHRKSKYLNNRAETSHQPIRQREWAMKRFTSPSTTAAGCDI
jgi:transposase-like protein